MELINFWDFIKDIPDFLPKSQFVSLDGFKEAYVRKGPSYIDGERYSNVLTFARIDAVSPGAGAFSALIKNLRETRPELTIYVECVQTKQFENGLLKRGFKRLKSHARSFYLTHEV